MAAGAPRPSASADPSAQAFDAAVAILRALQGAGHVAVLAGGCVRDRLLGRRPKDFDVATDAHPPRIRELFPRSRLVGEAFGVVLVRGGGCWIEVATFRREAAYLDGRRPSQVEFADMQADARRRDFTINGLFEDPLAEDPEQRIIDLVGGRADLEAGLIRAIGDPQQRFAEDYLRLLRAVRFCARFDFALEAATERAIRDLAPLLERISRERIGQELRWMLERRSASRAAQMVQTLGLDAPAFNEPHHDPPLPTLGHLTAEAPLAVKLLAWSIDRHAGLASPGDPPAGAIAPAGDLDTWTGAAAEPLGSAVAIARGRWRRALCLTNDETESIANQGRLLREALIWPKATIASRKRLLAHPAWPLTRSLLEGLRWVGAVNELVKQIDADAPPLFEEGVAPPPLTGGDDLIAMGLPPGPRFKLLLDAVYDEQLEGRVQTRQQALAWLEAHV